MRCRPRPSRHCTWFRRGWIGFMSASVSTFDNGCYQSIASLPAHFEGIVMLKGKTALVTGSTSGIGLGIALALARQGANIVLNGFGDHAAPQAAVAAHGVRVGYHGADMSKWAEIEAMMAYAAAEFGGVDILVNNAGIQHVAPVETFPVERWDAIIGISLSS